MNRVAVDVFNDGIVILDKPINDDEPVETAIEHTISLGSRPEVRNFIGEQRKGQAYMMEAIIIRKNPLLKLVLKYLL